MIKDVKEIRIGRYRRKCGEEEYNKKHLAGKGKNWNVSGHGNREAVGRNLCRRNGKI